MTTDAFQLALEHHRAGRLAQAEALYRGVLERDPGHARAAFLLGAIALGEGRAEVAASMLRRSTELDPTNAAGHANLGEALRRLRRVDGALESFEKALSLQSDRVEPVFNLGLLLQQCGALEPALACFELAAATHPDHAPIARQLESARAESRAGIGRSGAAPEGVRSRGWVAIGAVNRARGRLEVAIAQYRSALGCDPRSVSARLRLADALAEVGETDEASERLRQVLQIDPGHKEALARLLEVLESSCRLDEAVAMLRRCLEIANVPSLRSLLVLTLPYLTGSDAATVLREARAWDREHASSITARAEPVESERRVGRRLRIGYVAPYFRDHAHKFFLEPLLANHDRTAFELFFYSDVARPDEETKHIRAYADVWRDTARLGDDEVAALVRADRIDLLVDLAMHTQDNRLLLFARRPAPVQLCWLAYPGTTGLSAMDYRVTDPYLDPSGSDLSVYSERSLFLPDSFWCYSPRASGPEPTPLPALTEGRVTFGCLNNFCKVSEPVLDLWASVLRAVEDATLVVLAPRGDARRRAARVFERSGVSGERLRFVDRMPRGEYLASHGRIDIGLDPFPVTGHTTSLDALWMGVPIVTLAGTTSMGRAGVCFAMNLGLPELIAQTPRDYVRIAVDLARDLPRLSRLRAGLRARMEASPLMDGPRFARHLESLYRRAWEERTGGVRSQE